MENTEATQLVRILQNVLLRLNLPTGKISRKCYDEWC